MTLIGREDSRSTPLKRVHTCAYCKGHTHVIDKDAYPNDRYAREGPEGSGKWKCGNCQDRELEDKILELTPNSERARQIIVERQQELDEKLRMDEYMSNLKSGMYSRKKGEKG